MTRDVYVPWGTDAVACPEALTQVPVSHVNRTFSTADFAWMFDGTPGGLHTMGFEDPQTFKKNLYVYTFMEVRRHLNFDPYSNLVHKISLTVMTKCNPYHNPDDKIYSNDTVYLLL